MHTKLFAGVGSVVLAVAMLPLLATPGSGAADLAGGTYECGDVATILTTIRTIESNSNYSAQAAGSSASGAYQYIDSTWQHWAASVGIDTHQFPTARSASPADQDTAAAANVREILTEHLQDASAVPVAWYYPAALDKPALMDTIPAAQAGNVLTPRQYQARWMNLYQRLQAGKKHGPQTNTCSGTISYDGQWALPAPRDVLTDAGINQPHHDYPAIDLLMPAGTPVFAITGGRVERTTHFNANWWTSGCNTDTPPGGCATCGMGITIQSPTGLRETYCHNSVLYVNDGDTITVGQHIADSGNTGRSGTPHLHLELHYQGQRRCPQPFVAALYDEVPVPDLASLPTAGCTF